MLQITILWLFSIQVTLTNPSCVFPNILFHCQLNLLSLSKYLFIWPHHLLESSSRFLFIHLHSTVCKSIIDCACNFIRCPNFHLVLFSILEILFGLSQPPSSPQMKTYHSTHLPNHSMPKDNQYYCRNHNTTQLCFSSFNTSAIPYLVVVCHCYIFLILVLNFIKPSFMYLNFNQLNNFSVL